MFYLFRKIWTPTSDSFGQEDMHLIPHTEYNKIPLTEYPLINFFIQNNRYSKWFKNDYDVFYSPSVVDIQEPISKCEELLITMFYQ